MQFLQVFNSRIKLGVSGREQGDSASQDFPRAEHSQHNEPLYSLTRRENKNFTSLPRRWRHLQAAFKMDDL